MNTRNILKRLTMLIAMLLLAMGIFGCAPAPANAPEPGGSGQTSQGSAIYGDKQHSLDELIKNADLIVYGTAGKVILTQEAGDTIEFNVEKCIKGLNGGSINTANKNTSIINIMQMYSVPVRFEEGQRYVLALATIDSALDEEAVEMGIVRNCVLGAETQGLFKVDESGKVTWDKSFDSELKTKNPTVDELLSLFEDMLEK